MNRFTKRLSWAALVSVLFFIFGCSDELISTPISEGSSSAVSNSKNIQSPTSLVATHGKVNKIELSWMSSVGAKLYKIYASDSPFSDFVQIGEVSGEENFFTVEETSGVSKYFKITASDSNKNESSFSNVAFGSTLATPFITKIEMGVAGTSAIVKWWMENCTISTYAENVLYEITAYSEDLTTLVGSATSSGTNLFAEINGLSPKTKYFFQVEAYLNSDQTAIELSEKVDEETARKLVPNPVENLVIDEGISESEINLSFDLPDFCDVSVGKGAYERHPLYFTIQRKEKDAADRTYETLVSYLGAFLDSSKAIDDKIVFDCSSSTSTSELIKVEQSTSEDAEINTAYPLYISKSKITYTDKTAKRGKQYTYKIQSFVDDVKKNISSDESIALSDGWLISVASLRVTGTYIEGEGNKYSNISFKFVAQFNNYGKEYSYILKTIKTDLNEANGEPSSNIFDSLESLNAYKIDFSDLETDEGYYKYSLFVCPKNSTSDSDAITYTNAPGKYIVTNDTSKVPIIEEFKVDDGFADKFDLSWKYNEGYKYTIKWNSVLEDGSVGEDESLELVGENLNGAENDKTFTFHHAANSGERRIYKLEANNGLSTQKDPENGANAILETLGTAKIQTAEKEYDSISFSWDKVQKATDYEIHAYYSDDESKTEIRNTDSSEYTITNDEANGIISCKIDKPIGYDDATKSGKDVVVKVIAKNTKTNSTTEKTEKTATLGPANINATVSGAKLNLFVKWNKIDDANGYLVCRAIYKDGNASEIEKIDTIFIDDKNSVKVAGDSVNETGIMRANVSLESSVFTLTDTYKEVTNSESAQGSYQINQSKIAWGLPFGYFIVPVKSDSDFTFDYSNNTITSIGKVAYSNINDVKGATYGYGLNVKASKATSANAVMVSWEQPYNKNRDAVIYRRRSGSNEKWEYVQSVDKSSNETLNKNIEIKKEDLLSSYEYSVSYSDSNSTFDFADSYEESLNKDIDSNNEQQNKGYVLSLRNNIKAEYLDGFVEKFTWIPHDYEDRAVGPDWYEVQVNNLNTTRGWTTVARINTDLTKIDGEYKDKGDYAVIDNVAIAKVKLHNDTNGKSDKHNLQIEPIFDATDVNVANVNAGGYTTGALKVLRDGKHYYRLVAKRKFKPTEDSDEITIYASVGDDMSVWAYRQITDEELAKSAMLALSYAFYLNDGGKEDLSNVLDGDSNKQFKYGGGHTFNSANGGSVTFDNREEYGIFSSYSGKYHAKYSLSNKYAPNQLTPSGKYTTFLGLSNGNPFDGGFRIKGNADNYIYQFANEDSIDVSSGSSDYQDIYTAVLKFSCSGTNNLKLSITRNGETKELVNTNDNTTRKRWFPMQIHDNKGYEIKSTFYGWWED